MGLFNTIFGDIKITDVLIGLLTITCSYVFYFYYKYFTRLNPLPGPIPLPLIGSFAIFMEDIDAWFFRLNKIYGRDGIFELNIAGNRQIIMTRTDYVDKFMTSSTSSHIMRTANNGLLDLFDLHNKGVGLNHSYQHWKFNRQIFSQAVMPLSLTNKPSNILNQLFEEMAGLWIDLKPENDYGTTIDMAAWLRRFTADFISLLTTGKHISVMNHYRGKLKRDVMTEEMIESEEFIDCINTFVSDNQIIFVPKILKDLPLIKPRVNKLLDNCDRFYNKLVNIIRNRRKEIEKEIKSGLFKTEQMDLLTSLIIANTQYDPNPQKNLDPTMNKLMTDDEIRGVMFDAFVAGTDTTVNTFCFALYYLAHHPEVKKKMLEEINSIYKDDPTRPITLEDLDKLKYVEAIIKETSRIRPTVSMISRYSNKPDEIAGYKWPTNTLFIMYVRGINNNPLYWKDPEKFIPERFCEPQEEMPKNAFTMFGGGLRICLGRKIAIIELKTLMALLFRKFDVELIDMEAPLEVETSTITTCNGLNIKIIPKEKII